MKNVVKKRRSHSLNRQITFIFVAIMFLTIAACFFVNNVFLEKYYTKNIEKTLRETYAVIEEESDYGDIQRKGFDRELKKISATHNISIAIVTSLFEPVKIYSSEPDELIMRELRRNLFNGSVYADEIIENNDDYLLIRVTDKDMKAEYLEMLGTLPDGSLFFMRTPIESIRASAKIANRFLLYTGIGGIVISAIVIFLFTKKISKPILEIADVSERVSEMDFSKKYAGKEKSEIGDLGNSINKMSENLEKAIEELKQANVSLKEENDYKTQIDIKRREFISNVSHDLKTPIALIQGYAEGLKEGVNDESERDYYCDVIMDEASRMNKLVKQLLTLTKIEEGADPLALERFDLSELVKNYIQSAEILTKAQGITVNVEADEDAFVFADEFKIEEAFANYFSNAINHCESDVQKVIDVTVKKEENKVKVWVENTGESIPSDALSHVFEKFYRVDAARTREYGGSGVGLSIVKAVIDAHGGEYGVINTKKGVAFFFALNMSEESNV